MIFNFTLKYLILIIKWNNQTKNLIYIFKNLYVEETSKVKTHQKSTNYIH